MRSVRVSRAVSLLVACAVLAACGDGTAPKPSIVTVDTLLAEISEAQAFGAAGLGLGVGTVAFGPMPTRACSYNDSNQRFECSPMTVDGLTASRYYQLLDAAGAPQSAFNRTTTAAIRSVSDMSGTIDTPASGPEPASSFTITAHDDQTLGGLLTGTHVLNGTGTSTIDFTSGGISFTINSQSTTTNLVLPRRGSRNAYPTSGSMAFSISSPSDGIDISLVMTFNGTSTVTMTISSSGVTQTCTFDLAKPSTAPVCS